MIVHQGVNSISEITKPILTVGTFDGIHLGHQKIIKRIIEIAKNEGGESVLLTFHPHPRLVLFPEDESIKMINSIDEKIELLEELGLDHIILMKFEPELSRLSPVDYVRNILVSKIGIHKIVIGYDHHFGRNREGNIELLRELGPIYEFEVEEISALSIDAINISSTKIRKAVTSGDMLKAREYLGHNFMISGKVIHGKKIGRSIGFPTANIELSSKNKLLPKNGVYLVNVSIGGESYDGVLNIGKNPTVSENKGDTKIEIHLFDFDSNIYGAEVVLKVKKRIRSEQKFEGIEALKAQITSDVQIAKTWIIENV